MPIDRLLTLGETTLHDWPDYRALGVDDADVEALVAAATAPTDARTPEAALWAPVHAWRALAQLGDPRAIAPLVSLMATLDDDWAGEELPRALAMFGPRAIPALVGLLDDAGGDDFARGSAATALGLVAAEHPDARDAIVGHLARALERYETQSDALNAFLLVPLVDLRAVEVAPLVERAYAADAIDPLVFGDWEDVQVAFGMLPERRFPRAPLWEDPRDRRSAAPPPPTGPSAAARAEAVRKRKARQKQAKASKRKNRRRR